MAIFFDDEKYYRCNCGCQVLYERVTNLYPKKGHIPKYYETQYVCAQCGRIVFTDKHKK